MYNPFSDSGYRWNWIYWQEPGQIPGGFWPGSSHIVEAFIRITQVPTRYPGGSGDKQPSR